MALFQKKPAVSDNLPLYTLGNERTVLIVGLGNPGKKYDGTRHNIGFAVVESFAEHNDFPKWLEKKDLKCLWTSQVMGSTRVLLVKPTTFMNLSGEAVQAVQHFYKVPNSQTVAVYDELAIPFGQLRTRVGGSDAGHNGVKSLIERVGDDFGRVRVGVRSAKASQKDQADFVLAKFSTDEHKQVPLVIKEAQAILTEFIYSGALPHDTRKVI